MNDDLTVTKAATKATVKKYWKITIFLWVLGFFLIFANNYIYDSDLIIALAITTLVLLATPCSLLSLCYTISYYAHINSIVALIFIGSIFSWLLGYLIQLSQANPAPYLPWIMVGLFILLITLATLKSLVLYFILVVINLIVEYITKIFNRK